MNPARIAMSGESGASAATPRPIAASNPN